MNLQVLADKLKQKSLKRDAKTVKPKLKSIKPVKKPSKKETSEALKTRLIWWGKLSRKEQKEYLREHPKSKLELKKSVTPDIKPEKTDKKTSKKLTKQSDKAPSNKQKAKKATKPKPITESKKTTTLFKVDHEEVNKVAPEEQQDIHDEIAATVHPEPKDNNDEPDDVESPDDSDEPDDVESPDDSDEQDAQVDDEDELEDKIDEQLHPKQKLRFMQAAKIALSKNASREDKQAALEKLSQLHCLITLTKIAGAATTAALVYHFGSFPAAQCATFFALEHGNQAVHNSSAIDFLRRWGHKRATGEDLKDTDRDFNKLLGVYNHVQNKGHGHHKTHHKKH